MWRSAGIWWHFWQNNLLGWFFFFDIYWALHFSLLPSLPLSFPLQPSSKVPMLPFSSGVSLVLDSYLIQQYIVLSYELGKSLPLLHPSVPPFFSLSLLFFTQHPHSFFLVNIRLWVYEYIQISVALSLCGQCFVLYLAHNRCWDVEGRKEQDIINSWLTSSPHSLSWLSRHDLIHTASNQVCYCDFHLHSLRESPYLCHCY